MDTISAEAIAYATGAVDGHSRTVRPNPFASDGKLAERYWQGFNEQAALEAAEASEFTPAG